MICSIIQVQEISQTGTHFNALPVKILMTAIFIKSSRIWDMVIFLWKKKINVKNVLMCNLFMCNFFASIYIKLLTLVTYSCLI